MVKVLRRNKFLCGIGLNTTSDFLIWLRFLNEFPHNDFYKSLSFNWLRFFVNATIIANKNADGFIDVHIVEFIPFW
jgi:hypothetical protein